MKVAGLSDMTLIWRSYVMVGVGVIKNLSSIERYAGKNVGISVEAGDFSK